MRPNEDIILIHQHMSRFRFSDPVGLAFLSESDELAIPSTILQLIGVDFIMHERSGPDHPEMAKVGILAVERLVRRPVLQSCVRSPVAQVDGRLHQLPPK